MIRGILTFVAMVCTILLCAPLVAADTYSSATYRINGEIGVSSGGDSTSSATYHLISTMGESVVGQGSGGSYKLDAGYIAQLSNSLSVAVQPTGLIAYLPLDAGVSDKSPVFNAANSAITTVHSTAGATSIAGKVGNALQFNGTTQYIDDTPSDPTAYNPVTNMAGTVELWFKVASAGASDQFFASREGGCMGWQMVMTSTGQIRAQVSSTPSACGSVVYTSVLSPSSYANNAWHHAAMTVNRSTSTLKLYIDGQMVISTNTIPASDPAAGGTLKIAADYANTHLLTGALDEIKILTRDLRADEINAEYTASNVGTPSGLSLGSITPGVSNTTMADIMVQADTGKYSLAVNQNNDLKNGSYTIPAVSANIAVPGAWTEGTTKGFGFTLTTAPNLDVKWSSGANYAALPGSSTTFYSRTGGGASVLDTIKMRFRSDVSTVQPSGNYTNVVTVTGTITP
jgi:hypothetical protein